MRVALLALLLIACSKAESERDIHLRNMAREYNSCLARTSENALRFYAEQRAKGCWGPSDSEDCAIEFKGHRLASEDAERRCVTLFKP